MRWWYAVDDYNYNVYADDGDKYNDCNITGKWIAKNFSVLGVISCKAMQSYAYEYVEYDDYVGDADNDDDNHDYDDDGDGDSGGGDGCVGQKRTLRNCKKHLQITFLLEIHNWGKYQVQGF